MITTRIAATFAAGALAVGLLAGSAGAIVLRDATALQAVGMSAHMSQMDSMMSMMVSGGGMMNGQNPTGPAASAMPDSMQQHHVTSSPVPTQ